MCVCVCVYNFANISRQIAVNYLLFILFEWSSKNITCNKIYLLTCFLETAKLQPCFHKFKTLYGHSCPTELCTYNFWEKKRHKKTRSVDND